MKKGFVLLIMMAFGLVLVSGVVAQEKGKPGAIKTKTIKAVATVEAIDLDKRLVTLKGPKGNVFSLTVGEKVKNLDKVKVGDLVDVRYYEAVAFKVKAAEEAGEAEKSQASSKMESAKPGEEPAGVAIKQRTITANIEALDAKTQHVTLKGPEGNILVLKVKNPKYLENVKVGDKVTFIFTDALAVSVVPAKKK